MGDLGHLSNDQAAALLRDVLRRSVSGRVQHLVQLHLSRECNSPALAVAAAQAVFRESGEPATIHTAQQDAPGPNRLVATVRQRVHSPPTVAAVTQALLPGWEAG